MRLKMLGSLLAFFPLLLHAQDDEQIYERFTDERPTVGWYFGVNENEHERRVEDLKANNFRPTWLSAYGNPGKRMVYYHYGSMLLGHLVASLTEIPYLGFLKKHILAGLDMDVFVTDVDAHLKDETHPDDLQVGVDARFPVDKQHVPGVYGGDGAIKEECAAAFSLSASASTLVKFAGKYSVARMGHPRSGYRRSGVEGGYAFIESYGEDFGWAVVFTTREFASKDAVLGLVDKMHDLWIIPFRRRDMAYTCLSATPATESSKKDYPGLAGIAPEDLRHLPDCTKEQIDKMFRGEKE